MSGYYGGPFGRVLPAPNERQPWREGQERPRSPALNQGRYQLPPPRKPLLLRFGSDTSIQTLERRDSAGSLTSSIVNEPTRKYSQEQLPPVSQLLTPASPASLLIPYVPHTRGNSPPSATSTQRSIMGDLYHRSPQSTVYGGDSGRRPSYQAMTPVSETMEPAYGTYQPYGGGQLPSISQVGLDSASLRAQKAREGSGSAVEVPASRFHQGQLPYGSDLYNSDISPVVNTSPVSGGTTTFHPGSPTANTKPRLAHVVDERFVEGEGVCYIYSDGTHCPKAIDGEPVNASWGITKAGKPRKRLAQACMTCREKKIKCLPNLPKCDQCQKSGRECRFENAPRGNQKRQSPSSVEAGPHDDRSSLSPTQQRPKLVLSDTAFSFAETNDLSPLSGHPHARHSMSDGMEDSQPDYERPSKRRRRGSSNPSGASGDSSKRAKDRARGSDPIDNADILSEIDGKELHDPRLSAWEADPYETHPESTIHYLNMYFTYVNGATYCMFPREPFMRWLSCCRDKTLADKMLLYSLLAMGTVFSNRGERTTDGKRFARIARYAVEKSRHRLTLQLAQSRIILSLWHFTMGASAAAWDLAGSAMRTVCGLRLNVEPDGKSSKKRPLQEHSLQTEALMECHRRTFWTAFLVDRHTSFLTDYPNVLKSQDVFLRLPCREDLYEVEKCATMPYFQNGILEQDVLVQHDRSSLDPMAFLVEISAIWGDVLEHICRSAYVPSAAYATDFEDFYEKTVKRTDQWLSSLPTHFTYSAANMECNIRAGKTDTFVAVHILYHATMMKLNRHARHDELSDESINRNVRGAQHHAREILRITLALTQFNSESGRQAQADAQTSPAPPRTTFSTPLTGYAILSATDVLSAAGSLGDLSEFITLINSGLDVIEELARFFHSARVQLHVTEPRIEEMIEVAGKQARLHDKLGFAVEGRPLDAILLDKLMPTDESCPAGPRDTAGRRGDLVYCLPRDRYFRALGLEEISVQKGNVLWIRSTEIR